MSYIGISGTRAREECELLLCMNQIPQKVVFGVLTNNKLLNNSNNRNCSGRYTLTSAIKDVYIKSNKVLNFVYYASNDQNSLANDLERVVRLGGSKLNGIQISCDWPKQSVLIDFKEKYPNIKLALSLDQKTIGKLKNDNFLLAQKVKKYAQIVDFIVLDFQGVSLNEANVRKIYKFVKLFRDNFKNDIIISADFNETNVEMVKLVVKDFSAIGLNTENGIRNYNDYIDLGKMQNFILKASEVLSG